MTKEVVDKNSGAILFKKDPDSLRYEEILRKLNTLVEDVEILKSKIEDLENR